MTTTFSLNKLLPEQGTGDNPNSWGVTLNAALTDIDLSFGGRHTISVTTATATASLSQPDALNVYQVVTGALTADVVLQFPSVGSYYYLDNKTTGGHDVIARYGAGGATYHIPAGENGWVFTDPDVTGVLTPGTRRVHAGAGVALAGSQAEPTLSVSGTVTAATTFNNLTANTFALDVGTIDILALGGGFSENSASVNFTGNVTLDLADATLFWGTVAGDTTLHLTNVLSGPAVQSWSMEFINGGVHDVTWFPDTAWPHGTEPTLTTSGVDILSFYTRDGGTTIRGVDAMTDSKVP